jgi:hypothetical protein
MTFARLIPFLAPVFALGFLAQATAQSLTYTFNKKKVTAPLVLGFGQNRNELAPIEGGSFTTRLRPNTKLLLHATLQAADDQRELLELKTYDKWVPAKPPGLQLESCLCDKFICEITYLVVASSTVSGTLKLGYATEELGEAPPRRPLKTLDVRYTLEAAGGSVTNDQTNTSNPANQKNEQGGDQPAPKDNTQATEQGKSELQTEVENRVKEEAKDEGNRILNNTLPSTPSIPSIPLWGWITGGVAGLFALVGAAFMWLRNSNSRKAEADEPAPAIKKTPQAETKKPKVAVAEDVKVVNTTGKTDLVAADRSKTFILQPSQDPLANHFYEITEGREQAKYFQVRLDRSWADSSVVSVYIHQSAARQIRDLVQQTTASHLGFVPKAGGFLLGRSFYVPAVQRYLVSVEYVTTAPVAEQNPRKVIFGLPAWLGLDNALQQTRLDTVGWFRTQPEGNLRLSPADQAITDGFFNQPHHLFAQVDVSSTKWGTAFFSRKANGALNDAQDRRTEWISWHEVLNVVV